MKRILVVIAALFALQSSGFAADSSVPAMGNATSVAGTDGFYCIQSAGTVEHECTSAQMAAYIYGLMSGDATAGGTGALTLAAVNSNVGSFGSATTCTAFTTNAKGLITAASAVTCTPAIASVTGLGAGVATALAIAPGTAGSFVVNGGALGTPSSGVGTNLTALNASNLASGTVAAARGGAGTITGALKGSGAGVVTQAACADLSNGATGCSTAVGTSGATIGLLNAANSWSGVQTYAASDLVLTGGSGCATFTAGVLSSTGSACGSGGSTGANPTATAGPTAVNGTSPNFMRSDGAPAVQLGTGSAPGLVQCGLGLTCTAGVAGSQVTQRNNTATTDTLIASDAGTVVTESNASAVAVGIAVASTTGFTSGNYWTVKNKGAGLVTITPTSSTIDGAATFTLTQNQSIDFYSDGANYITLRGPGTATIASGTAAMGTSAIASGACATVVTVSATGVATTDTVMFGYNGDPTAVTGYGASASGAVLSIYPYPTSNNVNVKVCNSTASSITPSALTLNFRVVR